MPTPSDPFRPHDEPALTIYQAFQTEAQLRKARSAEEWMDSEVRAVHDAAIRKASEMGLRAPSREEVMRAERRASGHTDYGLKWALGVTEAMRLSAGPVGSLG